MDYDVLILGAGAAGLHCAAIAKQRGLSVLVVDHANKVGKKVLMSGGGRCNFTNLGTRPEHFLSQNPHFVKSALARYTPQDFLSLVKKHAVAYHEKELGQLFCDVSSKEIVRLLLAECEGVEIRLECHIQGLSKTATGFELSTSQGTFQGRSVVVATGGLSIPTMGATGLGYDLARQFGHTLVPTRASLVPITLTGLPLQDWDGLAGLAAPVRVTSGDQFFDHSLLITHRGLSGPAILQISNYWEAGMPLSIDWLRDSPNPRFLRKQLIERMPKRLADRLLDLLGDQHPDWLRKWPITASGTEGYRTAEVTLGGVDTDEISSQTMESKRVAGLYFIGEVLDVTGWLGGYNFQWAWASAAAAGRAAS